MCGSATLPNQLLQSIAILLPQQTVSRKELQNWCSWCHEYSRHQMIKKNAVARDEYQCASCSNYTIKCRWCDCMATLRPATPPDEGVLSSIKGNWASELCAEHNGRVSDFTKLDCTIEDLSEFGILRKRRKINLRRIGTAAGGVVAGAAVFGPLAYLAAPRFAAMLGVAGFLGTASTGATIATLQGAALTSASLAAIGPGGVAGGVILISAAGAGLGAREGAVVSQNYFGAVKDFDIIKLRDGSGPSVILVNGFLQQKDADASDWLDSISDKFPRNPCYLVTWESSTMSYFGKMAAGAGGALATEKVVQALVQRQGRSLRQKISPLNLPSTAAQLLGNKWHGSMVKAAMTGLLLADLISRTNQKDGFILMGHSLGARVIYFCLEALSTRNSTSVIDAYLLGGAIGLNDPASWDTAASAVSGNIYNIYSKNDAILKNLYRGANAFLSNPIGLQPIYCSATNVQNFDASSLVTGHMKHKSAFSSVLQKLDN